MTAEVQTELHLVPSQKEPDTVHLKNDCSWLHSYPRDSMGGGSLTQSVQHILNPGSVCFLHLLLHLSHIQSSTFFKRCNLPKISQTAFLTKKTSTESPGML